MNFMDLLITFTVGSFFCIIFFFFIFFFFFFGFPFPKEKEKKINLVQTNNSGNNKDADYFSPSLVENSSWASSNSIVVVGRRVKWTSVVRVRSNTSTSDGSLSIKSRDRQLSLSTGTSDRRVSSSVSYGNFCVGNTSSVIDIIHTAQIIRCAGVWVDVGRWKRVGGWKVRVNGHFREVFVVCLRRKAGKN